MDELTFNKINGHFIDRHEKPVSVFGVSGGQHGFAAFVYSCGLNLDKDGAANAYGYDNPAKGSIQATLVPLEFGSAYHHDKKGHKIGPARTTLERQRIGLGNACGDPGDGSKGHKNFNAHSRNFWWAGVKALTKEQARAKKNILLDERPDVEAGRETSGGPLLPVGSGYFPVINPDTGYYISTTSLAADDHASAYSPKHYLDSSVVPYAVWAKAWSHESIGGKKLHIGDFGLAIENKTGTSLGFVYGDGGSKNKVGECSNKIYDTLGGEKGLVTFIAFPGSGSGRMIKPRHRHAHYAWSPLGPNPESLIQQRARQHMLALQTNAAQLAAQLSIGSSAGSTKPSPHQAHLYQNLMFALSAWTFAA
jgi:hypothetical protein